MGCSYWAWIRPPWVDKWVMRSAMPARSLANPRAGSQPVVLVFLVSQKNLLMGPGQSPGVQCNMEGPTRVAQTSPPMWKCASIFCLYIKVCSASVFTILAGRRLLPPGWCSPWDHSPVGFGLWFMWLFQRSPGFVHGGSVSTLVPSAPLAESTACVVMQGRLGQVDFRRRRWPFMLSVRVSVWARVSLPFFPGLDAVRVWATCGTGIR